MADGNQTGYATKSLVVFDVEGILIPKNRYLLFEISRKVGFFGLLRILVLGLLYEVGIFSIGSALRRIYAMLNGLSAEEVLVRSGLVREDLERIRRIVEGDPSENCAEFDVVHDARLLARTEKQSEEALRTGTAKKLAGVRSAGG